MHTAYKQVLCHHALDCHSACLPSSRHHPSFVPLSFTSAFSILFPPVLKIHMVILIHGLFVPIRHVYSQQDNRIFCVLLNFFPLSALHFSSLWPWREYRAVTFPGPPQNFAFLLLSLFLSTSARVPGNDLVGPASDLCFPSSFLISFLLCKCTRK